MMGALSASYVKITTPLKISALKGSEVVVQQILDSIAPGLLPLAAVFAIYFYLVKRAALHHHFAVDCRTEHSLFVVGSAVNHDAEYLSTTGVEKVINACGKMTILGVSSVAPEVMQATARAASALSRLTRWWKNRRTGIALYGC